MKHAAKGADKKLWIAGGVIVVGLLIWLHAAYNGTSQSGLTQTAPANISVLYTNATANVRSCASTTCDIVGTYELNSSIPAPLGTTDDLSQLPEWVSFSYPAADGSSATGYINKSVLSPSKSEDAPVVRAATNYHESEKSTVTVSDAPTNSTLCNGIYYSSCAYGTDLVCPSGGGMAYCQQRASAQPSAPVEQRHYFLQNGSYTLLTDSEHEGVIQQKNATLQQLQDQINTLVAHSQKILSDSQIGCDNLGTLNSWEGNAAIKAQTEASICFAKAEYANNMIKLDNVQIQALQAKMQWINQNYQ